MLGWVHQAVAGEHEFLETLFDVKKERRMVGAVRTFGETSEETQWVASLLDESVEKLCLPLRVSGEWNCRGD